jgi:putative DNA primase/helicase
MGQIKSCRKYENPITFEPRFKLVMDSNYMPMITGRESAIWDRLRPVPFTEEIPPAERDKQLLEKLKREAAGILLWALEGCCEWQDIGLCEPPEVTELVKQWKRECDPIKEFIDIQCELGPDKQCATPELLAAFKEYTDDKEIDVSHRQFSAYLRQLGCTPERTAKVRYWVGIALREPQ